MHTKPFRVSPAYLSTFISRHPRALYTEAFSCHFSSTRMFSNRGSPSSKHLSVYTAQAPARLRAVTPPGQLPPTGPRASSSQEAPHYRPLLPSFPRPGAGPRSPICQRAGTQEFVCWVNERGTTGSTTDSNNPRDVSTSGWQLCRPLRKGVALGERLGGPEAPQDARSQVSASAQ